MEGRVAKRTHKAKIPAEPEKRDSRQLGIDAKAAFHGTDYFWWLDYRIQLTTSHLAFSAPPAGPV